jgi:tRNA modification GTPase
LRAVVSPVAGTTRDLLSAEIALERGMALLIDAAGVDSQAAGADGIAQAMHRRAMEAIEQADGLVLVHDATDKRPALTLPRPPDLVIRSKSDLAPGEGENLRLSAATGQGMAALRQRLDDLAFGRRRGGDVVALNDRHLASIADARAALQHARQAINAGAEFLALDLREALDALGSILGAVAPDELLGRIFSTFCIGK